MEDPVKDRMARAIPWLLAMLWMAATGGCLVNGAG